MHTRAEGSKSILGPSHPHQDISVACCNLYWQCWQLHRKTNNKEETDTAWVKHVQRASLDFLMALSSSVWCSFHKHLLWEALQMLSLPRALSKTGRSQSSKMKYIHVRALAFLESEPQLGQSRCLWEWAQSEVYTTLMVTGGDIHLFNHHCLISSLISSSRTCLKHESLYAKFKWDHVFNNSLYASVHTSESNDSWKWSPVDAWKKKSSEFLHVAKLSHFTVIPTSI